MIDVSRQGAIGVVLLVVGGLLLVPATGTAFNTSVIGALVAGTLLMTAGTYLLGTDVSGHPA
ncbi:MAG: hypothetical protein ABEJ61_08235 [Haloferacaceae archaeon]